MDERVRELEEFCQLAYPQLVVALSHHCGDRALGEELAQEALVRVWQWWSHVRELQAPIGWAFRVGANLSVSWWRRWQVEARAHARAQVGGESDEDLVGGPATDAVAVRRALAALTEKQRRVILLRFFLDLDSEQAGQVMGLSAGAVRGLTFRGLRVLREQLGDAVVEVEEVHDVP